MTEQQLKELVDIARCTPSAANRQPYRYKIVCSREDNEKVFACLGFAGYLKDWDGPEEGEKPTGYIILAAPDNVNAECDAGIIGQTMLLAAAEQGFGGCFFGNIKREQLALAIGLPQGLKIVYCLAFGYPKEKVVLEEMDADGDIKYYREEDGTHHVPKRKLADVLL